MKAVDEKAAETCGLREKELDRTVPFPRLKGGKRSGSRLRVCPFAVPGSSEKSDCILVCVCVCVCLCVCMCDNAHAPLSEIQEGSKRG